MKDYVTQTDRAYRITDSRVSLDSVVYGWRDGQPPESIRENFPVLTLEEVYGAITFYLANQTAIDTYLSESGAKFAAARQQKPQLYARLMAAKRQKASATSVPESVHP